MPNAEIASADAKGPRLTSPTASTKSGADTTDSDPKSQAASTSNAQASSVEQSSAGAVERGQAPTESSPLTLRGTSRGLEIWIGDQAPEAPELASMLKAQLGQSPDFFEGGDAILHFATKPAKGVIRALEETAESFSLSVVAVHTASLEKDGAKDKPAPRLSERKGDGVDPRTPLPATRFAPAYQEAEKQAKAPTPPMMIPGPVRSGTCFEAPGHLVVVGDVNPGAEIRAEGNIVVLGSLRGIAHAGAQGQPAFILALKLQPQQLRVGSLIARAGDADNPASGAEIAYAADNMIVVDEYQGRLPHTIASSI